MELFGKRTLSISEWKYDLDGMPTSLKIHSKGEKKNKKVLFLVAGGFVLWYDTYFTSVVEHLNFFYPSIFEEYEVIIVEKKDVCSLVMYDTFANYIRSINAAKGGIEELVMIGFSSGGVISSHVMARLHDLDCKKKIITYDTPWQIVENIRRFTHNSFYRIDAWVMYGVVQGVYANHYNHQSIKHHLVKKKRWGNGANELIDIVKNVHGFTEESLLHNSGWNFDLTADTSVINIYSARDPFHNIHTTHEYIEKNKEKIFFKNVFLKQDRCGHCSNMAFSTEYLESIMVALNSDDVENENKPISN